MIPQPVFREADVARRGRKRKTTKRYPSGDPVREKQPDDRVRTARQPHRRVLKEADRMSEQAESPLGRLCLRGIISEQALEAGNRFTAIVGAYRATIEAPASTARSAGGRNPCHVSSTGFCDPRDCLCLGNKERYDAAFEALSRAGQRPAKVVARVAVHREEITREDLVYLVIGLNALARHFGLTAARAPG